MKKLILILIVILLFLLLIWFWISRDSGDKNQTTTDTDLSGSGEISEQDPTLDQQITIYREPFILASIDFACELTQNPALERDRTSMENRLNSIYAQYNLPVQDDALMIQILQKYEQNSAVLEAIQQGTQNCANN